MKWSGDRAVSAGNSANPKEPRMKTLHTNAFKTGQWKTHRMWRRHRIKTMTSNTAVATDAGFNKLLILAPNNRNSIVGRSIQHWRTSCCNWLIWLIGALKQNFVILLKYLQINRCLDKAVDESTRAGPVFFIAFGNHPRCGWCKRKERHLKHVREQVTNSPSC